MKRVLSLLVISVLGMVLLMGTKAAGGYPSASGSISVGAQAVTQIELSQDGTNWASYTTLGDYAIQPQQQAQITFWLRAKPGQLNTDPAGYTDFKVTPQANDMAIAKNYTVKVTENLNGVGRYLVGDSNNSVIYADWLAESINGLPYKTAKISNDSNVVTRIDVTFSAFELAQNSKLIFSLGFNK
jgi:hypothetical protein